MNTKSNLLKSIFISLILVMGVNNAWAYNISASTYFYYDNSTLNWTNSCIQLMVGHSSWSQGYQMTKISNTNLYYVKMPKWDGATQIAVFGTDAVWGGEGSSISSRKSWAPNSTSVLSLTANLSGSRLLTVNSSATLSNSSLSSYTALNSQQTINTVVDGTVANSKATISLTSYAMTGNGTAAKQEATHGTGSKDSYIDAARTATTTLTVGDVEAGYQFDGWYTAATGGTPLETKKTYTYYPTAATTVYARFSTIKYTVTYGVHSSGNGTLAAKVGSTSINSGNKVDYGSEVVFTASPSTGYEIEGWYSNADCTTSLNNGTNNTYTIASLTAAATVYVKFKQKQHTVLFGKQGNGTITAKDGNTSISSGNKVNYGSTIVFTATPSTGYQIEGWYSNSTCTEPIDNETNNTYTVTITGGTNVYVKFEAIPANSHNITYTEEGTGWTYGAKTTSAEEGATVTFVVNPTAGYRVSVSSDGPTLTGPNASNEYTFTMPNKDVKISVDAKPEQYTVTLNKQSGTGGTSSVIATYLAAMPSITIPTKTGYTFNGYFDAASGGTKYYNADGSSAKNWDKTAATTLYAQWIANKYTVKFNANDGTGTMSNQSFEYDETKPLTANAFTRKGYEFTGWNTQANGSGNSYSDKESVSNLSATDGATVTLYAQWNQLPPTTVYINPKTDWEETLKIICDGEEVDITPVGCDGYYTAEVPGGTTELKFGGNNEQTLPLTVPADTKVLYDMKSQRITKLYLKANSNWKADGARFAAYFFGNGEKWVSMTAVADQMDLYEVAIPTDKSYPSVIFCRMNGSNNTNGWSNKWNQTADLTIPTDGTNRADLPANVQDGVKVDWHTTWDDSRWKEFTAPTYEITTNAGTGGTITVSKSSGITLNEQVTVTMTASTGYSFQSGTIKIGNQEEQTISTTESTHTICGPTTITAKWKPDSHTVTFNANGHGTAPDEQSVDHNEKVEEPEAPTADGYTFGGWYTDPNCTTAWNFDTDVVTGNITLYAQWTANTYTITYKDQGGSTFSGTHASGYPTTHTYNIETTLKSATKDGYTFDGWFTNSGCTGSAVNSLGATAYTANITLYAKWTGREYTVTFDQQSGTGGTNSVTATYGSAMPSITVPTRTGYIFGGYYTEQNGLGTQYYNADGTSKKTWDKTENATLYAYFQKAEITGIAFDKGKVPEGGYVTFKPTIEPTPSGNTVICWELKKGETTIDNSYIIPVEETNNVKISIAELVADKGKGIYTIKATLRTGTGCESGTELSSYETNFANTDFILSTPIYLKPSATWQQHNARFAVYYWGNGENNNGWVDMNTIGCSDEYYAAEIPIGYSHLQFVRMNPATKENKFQDGVSWNQTTDLTLPTNGNNLYDLTKIYLKPNANWKSAEARFAAYFFHSDYGDDKAWMSMLSTNEDGVYYCDVPTDKLYNKVSFVRMNNGNDKTNDWYNRWNQSKDIDLYNGSNFYTLEEGKWGKDSNGGDVDDMNVIYSGKWTKLEMPTITINSNANGNVVVKTVSGKTITNGEKVSLGSKVIVTMTPNNGYKVQTATINGETIATGVQYTICQNTTINVTFEIKEEWYVIGVDGDWTTPQERFRFVDGQLEVELDSNVTANFKIAHMQGTTIQNRYGRKAFSISNKSLTLTDANDPNGGDHCTIKTTYYGKYLFTWDAEQKKLTIAYPLNVGDYRLAYQDTQDNTLHVERVIKKCFTGDRLDTVSFFVRHNKQPKLVLQQCETLTNGVGKWKTINNNITFTVGKTGVWNFVLQQTNTPEHSVQVLTEAKEIKPYEGDYYIRTKSAKDGWTYFRSDSHKMTYSSYADTHEPFSHYFCEWVSTTAEAAPKTKNVRYTIANDYGECISDTLAADPEDANPRIVTNANGDLPTDGANVRFGWDWDTNELHRAYIAGSTNETENTFLRLDNAKELQNSNKNSITWIKFEDLQNWIYQVDVYASNDTKIDLTASYNGQVQYFKGGSKDGDERQLIVTTNDKYYKIRIIYDFKTNHLISAWLPGNETITTDEKLTADMMIIRRDQEQAEQLSFNPNTKQLDLQGTAYAVMTFTKAFIQDETYKERQRSLYWVSFPFDVKISDVFGFGEYGEHWILQYYDGAERAKKGLFIDSGTYWKYITNTETILKKGVGYVLALDLNKVQFLRGVEDVSLYFPSTGKIGIIKGDGETTTMEVPAHRCTITHGQMDRRIYDSHWNLIGIPGFTDPGMIDVTNYNNKIPEVSLKKDANLGFHYEFDLATNTYNVKRSTVAFKTMYSYLVQYYGTMEWNISAIDNTPAQIAARRNSNSNVPEKVSLRLEIAQNEQMIDQTFVQLQQEKATAEFDMNLDLTKIINSGANIYTLAGTNRIQTAGNTLPMNNATVPVGVVISKAGEYTFRMPDGTDGILVELIDYETNTTTNLLYDEYTVNLTKGTFENRFALFVRPNNTATSLENINGESTTNGKDVRKVLIDNILYIVRDGQIFDARGARVK